MRLCGRRTVQISSGSRPILQIEIIIHGISVPLVVLNDHFPAQGNIIQAVTIYTAAGFPGTIFGNDTARYRIFIIVIVNTAAVFPGCAFCNRTVADFDTFLIQIDRAAVIIGRICLKSNAANGSLVVVVGLAGIDTAALTASYPGPVVGYGSCCIR